MLKTITQFEQVDPVKQDLIAWLCYREYTTRAKMIQVARWSKDQRVSVTVGDLLYITQQYEHAIRAFLADAVKNGKAVEVGNDTLRYYYWVSL